MLGCVYRWFRFTRLATMSSSPVISERSPWSSLRCERSELRIDIVLDCGQSFRWRENSSGIWTGVMKGRVWRLSQTDHELSYQVFEPKTIGETGVQRLKSTGRGARLSKMNKALGCQPLGIDSKTSSGSSEIPVDETMSTHHANILKDYFQLDIGLESLYAQFCEKDPLFRTKANHLKGVRLLRQEPVETLFSFICSSNNNITRISGMIERMCQHFGEKITQLDGIDYYSFPSIERLAGDDVEQTLQELGFGYRARYVAESARQIVSKGGLQHLYELRDADYATAKASLMELHGVGAKVADCVCLMSLDKMEAIPVDTHVKQIAERDYSLHFATKSCTDAVYNKIGEFFRNLWGPHAGWAQCVLFALDLKKFAEINSSKIPSTDEVLEETRITKKRKRKLSK